MGRWAGAAPKRAPGVRAHCAFRGRRARPDATVAGSLRGPWGGPVPPGGRVRVMQTASPEAPVYRRPLSDLVFARVGVRRVGPFAGAPAQGWRAQALSVPMERPGGWGYAAEGRGRRSRAGSERSRARVERGRPHPSPLRAWGPLSVTRCHPLWSKKPPPFAQRGLDGGGAAAVSKPSQQGGVCPSLPHRPASQAADPLPPRLRPSSLVACARRGSGGGVDSGQLLEAREQQATLDARTWGLLPPGTLCPAWPPQNRVHLCTLWGQRH